MNEDQAFLRWGKGFLSIMEIVVSTVTYLKVWHTLSAFLWVGVPYRYHIEWFKIRTQPHYRCHFFIPESTNHHRR